MRVMIAYPPLEGKGSPMLTQNRQFQWFHEPSYLFPMVPASAATLLRSLGHEVLWVDAIAERRSWARFVKRFRDFRPRLVAMETKTPVVRQHHRIAALLKEIDPDVIIVLMGDHVTALPEESARAEGVDYALLGGDYDFSLRALVTHLEEGAPLGPGFAWVDGEGLYHHSGPAPMDGRLTELPWVDRHLTNAHLYFEKWKYKLPFMWTMAGRDCPWHRCTFCSWTTTYPKFRVVPPERLLDEVEHLVHAYGAKNVFDDTGTLPGGGWLDRFTEGMVARRLNEQVVFDCNFRFDYLTVERARRMRRAGFRKLLIGLESANQRTLDIIDKGLTVEQIREGAAIASEAGLQVQLTAMVGYPWETRADALRTLGLARELLYKGHAHHLQATVVVPYPGTPLYDLCVERDWLRFGATEWERFDMTEPACRLTDMAPEEVVRMAGQFYRLYLNPVFAGRQLLSARSVDDLDYLRRGATAILGHIADFSRLR
ncbi:MAG: radical SAM protein [Deltaproteobacteria bacterium]|nr:radical SAM protein [Deltaproteobacteria bacterium]